MYLYVVHPFLYYAFPRYILLQFDYMDSLVGCIVIHLCKPHETCVIVNLHK